MQVDIGGACWGKLGDCTVQLSQWEYLILHHVGVIVGEGMRTECSPGL